MANTSLAFDLFARDRTASRTFNKVGKSADGMGAKFAKVAKVASRLAIGGGTVLAAGLVLATKAAAQEETEMALLANALKKNTKATGPSIKATEKWITATQNATGVADGDLRPALAKLVGATKNTAKAQKLLKVGLDFSAQSGKSLDSVATALTKAYNGNVGALGRLGVKVQDSTKDAVAYKTAAINVHKAEKDLADAIKEHGRTSDEAKTAADKLTVAQMKLGEANGKVKKTTISFDEAMSRLKAQFGGAADAAAQTAQGQFKILQARFQDLKEAVGAKLLPVLVNFLTWINDKLIPGLGDLSDWVKTNVVPSLHKFWHWVEEKLVPAFVTFSETVIPGLKKNLKTLEPLLSKISDSFRELTETSGKSGEQSTTVGELFGRAMDAVVTALILPLQQLDFFLKILDKIVDAIDYILEKGGKIAKIASRVGGFGFGDLKDVFTGGGGGGAKPAKPKAPATGLGGSTTPSVPGGAADPGGWTGQAATDYLKGIHDAVVRRNRTDPLSAGWSTY